MIIVLNKLKIICSCFDFNMFSQTLVSDAVHGEGCKPNVGRRLRSEPETSGKSDQRTENNSKNLKYKCCNILRTNSDELKDHLMSHIEKFKCPHCSKEYISKYSLKSHLLKHSNVILFNCSEYNYGCYSKGQLAKHMLTHSNFKCSDCNYDY